MAPEEQIKALTTYMDQFNIGWTDTQSANVLSFNGAMGDFSVITNGRKVSVIKMANSIFINGKDITGNLGNTHVEIRDSNLNIGGNNISQTIQNGDTSFNPLTPTSIIVELGIALLAAYLIYKFGWNR